MTGWIRRQIQFPEDLFYWLRDKANDERREFRAQVIVLLEQVRRDEEAAATETEETR